MRVLRSRHAVALLSLALASCGGAEWAEQVARAPAGYRRLSPDEAQGILQDYDRKGVPYLLLDVRQTSEVRDGFGAIDGSTFIPHDQLGRRLDEIAEFRDALVVVVDRAGFRSRIAADYLEKAGFARIRDVDGGLLEWKRRGLPLTSSTPVD